jgi:PTS system mannose-specific IIC component
MLWSRNLAIFYFLGFVLVIYLGLPLVALAVIGVVIAVATAIRDMELADMQSKGVSTALPDAQNEEEEFFK